MFCPNCGQYYDDNTAVCPACSTPNPQVSASPVNGYAPFAASDEAAAAVKPKKSKKKIGIIITALVLVVALVVGGVFLIPELFGKSTKYKEDNVFAQKIEELGKDSENADVLNVFAAVYNTLFNVQSFTGSFESKDEGSSYKDIHTCNFKIQYGKDLADTQFIVNYENEYKHTYYDGSSYDGDNTLSAGMYDGIMYVNNDDDEGIKIDFANISSEGEKLVDGFADYMIKDIDESIEDYEERIEEATDEDDKSYYQSRLQNLNSMKKLYKGISDSSEDIVKYILSVVKGKKLNIEAVDSLLAKYMSLTADYASGVTTGGVNEASTSGALPTIIEVVSSFENIFSLLADYLAEGLSSDIYSIEAKTEGSGKKAVTEYEIKINIVDLGISFCEFAKDAELFKNIEDEDVKEMFSQAFEYYLKNLRSLRDNLSEEEMERYEAVVNASVSNNCISSLSVEVDDETLFTLTITDVNDTKITEEDIKEIEDDYEDCDDREEFENADDVLDLREPEKTPSTTYSYTGDVYVTENWTYVEWESDDYYYTSEAGSETWAY